MIIFAQTFLQMKKRSSIISAIILIALCAIYLVQEETGFLSRLLPGGGRQSDIPEGLMELPACDGDDIILTHNGFVISYNAEARIPLWVAYELTDEETRGELDRDEYKFQMDPSYGSTQAMREDYADDDYRWSRGHMAPAADFEWDAEAMGETFYLTNICPQDRELNKNDWNYLEKQVRNWARQFGKVWVVTGPVIGTNRYGTIGARDVVVPDGFFKAVLANRNGKYHSIAFVMDNDDKRYWLDDCAMSVDELESVTGLDFFPLLPDDMEDAVESKVTLSFWNIKER